MREVQYQAAGARLYTAFRCLFLCLIALNIVSCSKPTPLWSESERAILRSLSLASLKPAATAPSNRVANDLRAIEFGRALFFDPRLSGSNEISCATCHQPDKQFTDGLVTGLGANPLARNTPSIIGSAWQDWFYWDGRRDSLWAQALIPIEAPDEMGGSRVGAVQLIASDKAYRQQYSALFGPFPPALTFDALPHHAGEFTNAEGKDAWYRLSKSTQLAVNSAYANIGKALAAFERTLIPKASTFDRYVDVLESEGEIAANKLIDAAAIRGAKMFIDTTATRCMQCHNGPLFTNGGFHNIGTGALSKKSAAASPGQVLDFGRIFGIQAVLLDQFNCLGRHSDADPEECSALRFLSTDQHDDMAGAFKTPSLRNVAQTAPYLHDGQFETLLQVIRHYNVPPDGSAHELVALNLSESQLNDLVAFLITLSSPAYESLEPVIPEGLP